MFGLNCRLVRFIEKLTLCPNWGPLPHTSHLAIITPQIYKLKATVGRSPHNQTFKSGYYKNVAHIAQGLGV